MKIVSIRIATALLLFVLCPALAWSETTAYIPSFDDDDVKRILDSNQTSVAEVDVCDGPYGAAVTPDGTNLVLTCSTGNIVTVIPTENFVTASAQTDIDLDEEDSDDHEPRGVAIESQGYYAYVANFANDTVDEININSASVVDTFDVGDGPWGVAATYDSVEDEVKVYVTNHNDDSVSVISGTDIDTISDVGEGPVGAALTPDGGTLFVANLEDDTVAVIDTAELAVTATISVGEEPWGVAVAADGDYVFVTNSENDTVSLISTDTLTVSRTLSVGDQPMGIAAPVNGDFAYAVNQTDGTVSKITTDGTVTTIDSADLNGAFSLGTFIGGSAPDAPSDLEAVMESSSQIQLTWTNNADDAEGFKIEHRKDDEEEFVQVAKVDEDETTYTDYGLSRDTTYEYRVRAFNEASNSEYSDTASATTDNQRFNWCFINTLLH
jgi:YVTN family beta-propeller protein